MLSEATRVQAPHRSDDEARAYHAFELISYSAETTIKRQDFGLNWAQQTPGGTFIVGDNVDISITIEAVAQ